MLQWLDQAPLLPLVMVALLLGLAPFFSEPHLVEKLRLLTQGGLRRPLDIFDLCFHGLPVALLLVKLARMVLAGHGRA